MDKAETSPLASFARHLRRDQDAVLAALESSWGNGMIEDQIHRLKLLKRQMYGRAGFDLLKLRVPARGLSLLPGKASANPHACFTTCVPEPNNVTNDS